MIQLLYILNFEYTVDLISLITILSHSFFKFDISTDDVKMYLLKSGFEYKCTNNKLKP